MEETDWMWQKVFEDASEISITLIKIILSPGFVYWNTYILQRNNHIRIQAHIEESRRLKYSAFVSIFLFSDEKKGKKRKDVQQFRIMLKQQCLRHENLLFLCLHSDSEYSCCSDLWLFSFHSFWFFVKRLNLSVTQFKGAKLILKNCQLEVII